MRCDKSQSHNFHLHAHLDVFVDGHQQTVPAEIGVINNTCKYWIYTPDETGIIHVDVPEEKQFILAQFFDIWKTTSSLPRGGTPVTYINGQQVSSALNQIVTRSHDEIAIIYGEKPSVTIPVRYQFPPSL